MNMKSWALTMGLGAVAGAVAIMMLPRQSTPRKLADKAALAVEDAAQQVAGKLMQNKEM